MRAFEVFGSGNLADGAVALAELALLRGRPAGRAAAQDAPAAKGQPSPVSGPPATREELPVVGDQPATREESAMMSDEPARREPPTVDGQPTAREESATMSDEPAAGRQPPATSGEPEALEERSVESDRPATQTAPVPSGRPPVEVIIHVSASDLEGHTALGDGIPPDVARRLLCDSGVVPVLEDGQGRLIDVGRKKRTIGSSLRRALDARDGGCRFPGCTNRLFTDGHHLLHWIDGGETTLANTVLLCRRHHRYLHEYGFTVEWGRDDGAADSRGSHLVFRDPSGNVIPPQGPRPPVAVAAEAVIRGWVERPITPQTNEPGWDGTPASYASCLAALAT